MAATTGGTTGGGGTPTQTAQYRYVADVTFAANGHKRHIKGLERLDMLPNEASPLLLFLGVTPNGGNAVFLVDSTLKAAGEGKCKPKPRECAFLYIGPGSEHEFTNEDGDSYTLADRRDPQGARRRERRGREPQEERHDRSRGGGRPAGRPPLRLPADLGPRDCVQRRRRGFNRPPGPSIGDLACAVY